MLLRGRLEPVTALRQPLRGPVVQLAGVGDRGADDLGDLVTRPS
ncbi:MAG TPA: hypothetical protein VM347_39950 [Nonomuraea sp.]|nr:hypothetical protein [Nonomuraea sp.]